MMTDPIHSLLAPTGQLRATINVGNPILASREPSGGGARGISVDIANELARRLGVAAKLIVVDAAAKAVETVASDRADVGFFAVDPVRGMGVAFTNPYLLIEGCFLVRQDAAIADQTQVDTPEKRVAVGAGSAYDLFLTRELKRASIVRVPTSPAVTEAFLQDRLEVAAGIRQQLEADALRHGGLRLLEKPFMVIQQAMGIARGRGEPAAAYLRGFVDELRLSGYVKDALARHGIEGATAA
jgi:polar amino acid transport system substrate-binding protein